jgi:hypothetical protein
LDEKERDQLLLDAIMAESNGQIVNIMQAASEFGDMDRDLSLYERLSMAYYELTNKDPAALDAVIGLKVEGECEVCGAAPDEPHDDVKHALKDHDDQYGDEEGE